MINRRLYLESPTRIQRLLIVPYKLGTISSQDNRDNKSTLLRVQDNNGDVTRDHRTIANGTNNNCCLTIGWVSTKTIATQAGGGTW